MAGQAATESPTSASFYPVRLDDPEAVDLTPANFPVHGDGVADDSAALQQAIDKVAETHGEGIVFVPSGRYRITRTIYVWGSVRVIGYGSTRPVIVLGANTPGFQQGLGYMVFFSGGRPAGARRNARGRGAAGRGLAGRGFAGRRGGGLAARGPRPPFPGTVPPTAAQDAGAGTFYSAMSNIDLEIGAGNPAAVGIRFHVAQHSFLSHMDFHIGSGLAALKDIGNESEDLHFFGGQYGIISGQTSPGWQYTLLDSSFDGQRVAAIQEHAAGMTLVHDQFVNVPTAVAIDPGYQDELWIENSRFENISGPALIISNEDNPTTEINVVNAVCRQTPVFARLRASGQQFAAPASTYRVSSFTHGLIMADLGAPASLQTDFHARAMAALPPATAPAIRTLPAPDTWVNIRTLGAKGDGTTDDTAAIQKAIDSHATLYVPSGHYIVTGTIKLKPDTVLIGLDPSTAQFDLPDSTPGFQGPGNPQPLLATPLGGDNIVTGIGLYTNGINPRAVAALWRSGADSLMDDVRFLGGHGTNAIDGSRLNPYNNTHTADPDSRRKWDSQYPSLWINGGGGTFADIWTPSTFAQAGMMVSNTAVPGHVYELSSEHHVRNEIILRHVSHWTIDALQTEEEWGEGPFALPLEIDDSSHITVANLHSYRVIASYQPFPEAIRVARSRDIHFRNIHINSNSKVDFDSAVVDTSLQARVRYTEFAALNITGQTPAPPPPLPAAVVAPGAKLDKLQGGFFSISGGAADSQGRLYFIDSHWQRIYRWSPATHDLALISDAPLQPANLAFDRAGDLLVTSYDGDGTVYSFRPGSTAAASGNFTWLKPQPTANRPGMTPYLALSYWGSQNFVAQEAKPDPYQYVAPDGTTFIPVGADFVSGALSWGVKMADVLHAFGLAKPLAGHPFYLTEENEHKTFSAQVAPNGAFTGLKLFAERGGESVAQDSAGNVYIAAGDVLVYNPAGQQIGMIAVPERPVDLVFGGAGGKTLFILTHHTLYAVQMR